MVYNVTPGATAGGHFLFWEGIPETRIARRLEAITTDVSGSISNHHHPEANLVLAAMAISMLETGECRIRLSSSVDAFRPADLLLLTTRCVQAVATGH